MRVLAIETVDTAGSLALLQDDRTVVERQLAGPMRTAQSLAPGIAEMLLEAGWRTADVELVAVTTGPGSFTGLRIGVTTAKVFAYAMDCPLIGVNTMRAIASRVGEDVPRFSVVVDAQRSELFVADFSWDGGQLAGEETTRLVEAERWMAELSPHSVVSGPGLARWSKGLDQRVKLVDAALWAPAASAVGRVGWQAFVAGQRAGVLDLVPQYFRRTAAEEQWDRKLEP